MKGRWITFTLLAILVIGGLIAGAFTDLIQRALTLSSVQGHAAVATPTVVPTQVATNVLAQDTFQRQDQSLWGTASDGRAWEGDANTLAVFSISGATGQITNGLDTFNAVLGPVSTDTEVVASGSLSRFDPKKINLGVVLRWTDKDNWYKALIDGQNLIVLRRVQGVTTQLAATPFTASEQVAYTLRFRAIGTTLFARVWQSSNPEPTQWMVVVNDTLLPSGQGGVRVLLQSDVVVRIFSFLEASAA